MKKGLLIFGLCFLLVMMGFVSAMLYTEKILHPEEFTSIQPVWSAKIMMESGDVLTLSFLKFISPESKSTVVMSYLADSENEFLSEGGSAYYAYKGDSLTGSSCKKNQEKYLSCIHACSGTTDWYKECTTQYNQCKEEGKNEEIEENNCNFLRNQCTDKGRNECIDKCNSNYSCKVINPCYQLGPDGNCGLIKMEEYFADCLSQYEQCTKMKGFSEECNSQFNECRESNKLILIIDPQKGKLTAKGSSFNGETFKIIKQEGVLTASSFSVD